MIHIQVVIYPCHGSSKDIVLSNVGADLRRRKSSILTFPPLPSLKNLDGQFADLLPRSRGLIGSAVWLGAKGTLLTVDTPLELENKRRVLSQGIECIDTLRQLAEAKAWQPTNLIELMAQTSDHLPVSFNGEQQLFKLF